MGGGLGIVSLVPFSFDFVSLIPFHLLPPYVQELLIKDKMKKEAEKRRTQKKEKQRGCG